MNIDNKLIKEYLKNVYFINGTAYAGKSTVCKMLSEKHGLFLVGENYKFGDYLALTTPETHPHMNYFNTMSGWEEFVTRSKEEYEAWMKGVSLEGVPFEILELISLAKNQKVIAETNIPHYILKEITDPKRVVYMVATPEIAMNEFFNREDSEKNFLLSVIKQTKNPEVTLQNYKETIAYINRQEVIDEFINSGFYVVQRHSVVDDIHEKLALVEKHFQLE